MQTFKCHICQTEYDSYLGLSRHCRVTHQIDKDKLRVIVYNNGQDPLCKCGCGEQVSWNYKEEKFNDFKHGHYVRTTGGFYSPEGAKKSGETRKQKFASGDIVQWNKGSDLKTLLGEERANEIGDSIRYNIIRNKKIADANKGKPKSLEHREQMKKQLAINRRERLTSGKMSKPERLMQDMLESHGIECIYQYELSGFFYDFYIPSKNALIEVDGDFWHCKPGTKHEVPVMKEQTKNVVNDKKKTAIAYSNGYTLLRFWESDINENPVYILETLIENLL
jgi:very-short-patch-repair endonuclease